MTPRRTLALAVLTAALAAPCVASKPAKGEVDMVVVGDIRLERRAASAGEAPITQAMYRAIDTGQTPLGSLSAFPSPLGLAKLKKWRFREMSVADAGLMKDGPVILASGLHALDEHGIHPFGAGDSVDDALQPSINNYRDRQIGLLGLNLSAGAAAAGRRSPGVAGVDIPALRQAVADARAGCERLIVVLDGAPLERQPDIAREAVGAGADAVVFHDPSPLLGPVERVGEAVVMYGLGRFAVDAPREENTLGAIARITFGDGATTVRFTALDAAGGVPKPVLPEQRAKVRAALDALGALTKEPRSLTVD